MRPIGRHYDPWVPSWLNSGETPSRPMVPELGFTVSDPMGRHYHPDRDLQL